MCAWQRPPSHLPPPQKKTRCAFHAPAAAAVDKADEGWAFSTGFICEEMIREQLFPGELRLALQAGQLWGCWQATHSKSLPNVCRLSCLLAVSLCAAASDSTICCLCGPPPMIKFACLPVSCAALRPGPGDRDPYYTKSASHLLSPPLPSLQNLEKLGYTPEQCIQI